MHADRSDCAHVLTPPPLPQLPSSVDDRSGSTAIVAFVTPTHIIVGNCGDSRCMLVRGRTAVAMSEDHKPYNDVEKTRIINAGGHVTMKRVNGDLAVSRALGDFTYKHMDHLPAEAQQVSAEPEVAVQARTPADEFLVLACDGVWDVMTNQEVCDYILAKTTEGVADVMELSACLIDEGLKRQSRDNMSSIIVGFENAPKPTVEAAAKWRAAVAEEEAAAAAAAAVAAAAVAAEAAAVAR